MPDLQTKVVTMYCSHGKHNKEKTMILAKTYSFSTVPKLSLFEGSSLKNLVVCSFSPRDDSFYR